jgi:hypothetical protein
VRLKAAGEPETAIQDASKAHKHSRNRRFKPISARPCQQSPAKNRHDAEVQQVPSTTVVDRRLAAVSRAFGSGSEERGIGDAFAIGTSAADAQRRAIRAREGE